MVPRSTAVDTFELFENMSANPPDPPLPSKTAATIAPTITTGTAIMPTVTAVLFPCGIAAIFFWLRLKNRLISRENSLKNSFILYKAYPSV